ncbi:MAG: hypothetical protein WCV58_04280 [Patescibacteria group bacterium]
MKWLLISYFLVGFVYAVTAFRRESKEKYVNWFNFDDLFDFIFDALLFIGYMVSWGFVALYHLAKIAFVVLVSMCFFACAAILFFIAISSRQYPPSTDASCSYCGTNNF